MDEPEETRGDLMDQCSRHDTPPAVHLPNDRRVHCLAVGLEVRVPPVLSRRRLRNSLLQEPLRTH